MSYVDNTLLPDEVVRFRGHVHWIIFIPCLLLTGAGMALYFFLGQAIICGILLFFSIYFFLRAFVYYFTTELAVTSERVIAKFGFISRVTFELNLDRVMSLNVQQTVLGRILNYGDVFVNGMGGVATPIPVISDPIVFRKWVLGEVRAAT